MVKSNQYSLKIASNKIQDACDLGSDANRDNLDLMMKNDAWIDDWQVFASWICTKYAGKNVLITVKVLK